ncbi:hypothetical protein BDEG_28148 [Batrachochytrium dendrobatidis JEL423]|nr:hypothetical protein BDEG_28148 [Batrachochytrium dendrobatidis JEL423]
MKKRSGQLFQLGLGIGKLLRIADSAEFGKAFDALLSEFDVAIGDSPSKQKNSLFSRLNKTFGDQQLNNDGLSAYGLLEIVQLPFELDFIETYITLCEILVLSYSKLLPARGSDCPDSHFECVHRLDLKIKKHIIHSVIREINGAAKLILEEQFHALANGE